METKTKYLSYYTNSSAPDCIPTEEKAPLVHVLGRIMLGFVIVVFASTLMRSIEMSLNHEKNPLFNIPSVVAAETTDAALLTSITSQTINIKPDQAITITINYRNIGTSTWTQKKVFLKSSTTGLKFKHKTWTDPYLPAKLLEKSVAPGETGTFKLILQAPKKLAGYTGEFMLVRDNMLVSGGDLSFKMNVVTDPAAYLQELARQAAAQVKPHIIPLVTSLPTINTSVCSLKLKIANAVSAVDNQTCAVSLGFPTNGPIIRVGIIHTENIISIKNSLAWQVYDQSDILLASVPAGQIVSFFYNKDTKEYSFDYVDKTIRTPSYLKLSNFNNGLFTVTSITDSPSWNAKVNYNDFLGNLEIRYNNSKKRTWLIESLPMEEYVMGIKETSNSDPIEYLKTMSVAARTYAMYHLNKGTKHADEFFDVDATYDQVYKGQVTRLVLPNTASAVAATKGIVATYDSGLIVAAYFSRSDGRTRSFQEVWKSDVPYLQSVLTPYTQGRELWGHGVGIDATDAMQRAHHDGTTYDQLLKYYYTGIALEQIY